MGLLSVQGHAQRIIFDEKIPITPSRAVENQEAMPEILKIERLAADEPSGGHFFTVHAAVPKNQLAALEMHPGTDAGVWNQVDDAQYSVTGLLEFQAFTNSDAALFRVKVRPFPAQEVLVAGKPHLELIESVSRHQLSLFLRAKLGIKVKPEIGRLNLVPPKIISLENSLVAEAMANPVALDALLGSRTAPPETLKKLFKRPELVSIASGQFETSGSVVAGESLLVPMRWNVSRKDVKKARFVIQRTPFSDPSAETETLPMSTVGWVHNDWYPNDEVGVHFMLDFGKQSAYGIEAPQPFFVRLYELDASGKVVGWPSNTFTFVVREKSPVPAGELRFSMKRIKCWDTTSELGNDEVVWNLVRVRFGSKGVDVDIPSAGYGSFGGGDALNTNALIFNETGPGDYPNVDNTWYILAMKEEDGPPGHTHWKKAAAIAASTEDHLQIIASGMHVEGRSAGEIVQAMQTYYSLPASNWLPQNGIYDPEKIGTWTFRITRDMVDQAVTNGLERKVVVMHGHGSSYSTSFDLDFYGH